MNAAYEHYEKDEEILRDLQVNAVLSEFYTRITPDLQYFAFEDIPSKLYWKVVIRIISTNLHQSDWELYASDFLCDCPSSSEVLLNLKGDTDVRRKLYSSLEHACVSGGKSLADVVKVLLERKRYDVLREIRPFVEDLLNKKRVEAKSITQNSSATESLPIEEQAVRPVACPAVVVELPLKQSEGNAVSVFIPHTKGDASTAEQFSDLLTSKYSCSVALLWNAGSGKPVDIRKAMKEADFTLPLISSTYLQYLQEGSSEKENVDVKINNFVLRQLEAEYIDNYCMNDCVLPVLHPEVKMEKVKALGKSLLFTFYFRLFKDVPLLVDTMKKTKLSIKGSYKK